MDGSIEGSFYLKNNITRKTFNGIMDEVFKVIALNSFFRDILLTR